MGDGQWGMANGGWPMGDGQWGVDDADVVNRPSGPSPVALFPSMMHKKRDRAIFEERCRGGTEGQLLQIRNRMPAGKIAPWRTGKSCSNARLDRLHVGDSFSRLLCIGCIADDQTVLQNDIAASIAGDSQIMSNQDDGQVFLLVQLSEQSNYFAAGCSIQISCGLVTEQNIGPR